MRKEYKKIKLPVEFGDYAIVLFNGKQEEVINLLGEPHAIAEPLSEPGPCVYWAIGFECGLEIVISAYDPPGKIKIAADLPEPQHIARHLRSLGLDSPLDYTFEQLNADQQNHYFSTELRKAWNPNSRFQLWRQDDNGNRFAMSIFSSKRDALCAADFFDSTGHKQTYWIEQLS